MGIDSLNRRLAAIPKSVREAVQPGLQKQANDIAGTMRQLAETSRDTGDLIDSIEVTPGGKATPPYSQPGGEHVVPENAVAITAGNEGVRYPHLVEYGTTKAPAQPFFWPAYRLHKAKAATAIKRTIGKAVREGWQK